MPFSVCIGPFLTLVIHMELLQIITQPYAFEHPWPHLGILTWRVRVWLLGDPFSLLLPVRFLDNSMAGGLSPSGALWFKGVWFILLQGCLPLLFVLCNTELIALILAVCVITSEFYEVWWHDSLAAPRHLTKRQPQWSIGSERKPGSCSWLLCLSQATFDLWQWIWLSHVLP